MICLVTDRRRLSTAADDIDRLVDLVAAAARAGIDLIQIRERDLDARQLAALVRRCVDGGRRDRHEGARQRSRRRRDCRRRARRASAWRFDFRRGGPIADSATAPSSADRFTARKKPRAVSRAGGVDYLIFGTLYPSASKSAPHRVATLDELSAACQAGVPVLAIGGITVERAAEVGSCRGRRYRRHRACSCRRQGRRPIATCKPSRPSCAGRLTHARRLPNIDAPPSYGETRRSARAGGHTLMPQGPPARTVGARLREAREKRGVSLRQIANEHAHFRDVARGARAKRSVPTSRRHLHAVVHPRLRAGSRPRSRPHDPGLHRRAAARGGNRDGTPCGHRGQRKTRERSQGCRDRAAARSRQPAHHRPRDLLRHAQDACIAQRHGCPLPNLTSPQRTRSRRTSSRADRGGAGRGLAAAPAVLPQTSGLSMEIAPRDDSAGCR